MTLQPLTSHQLRAMGLTRAAEMVLRKEKKQAAKTILQAIGIFLAGYLAMYGAAWVIVKVTGN